MAGYATPRKSYLLGTTSPGWRAGAPIVIPNKVRWQRQPQGPIVLNTSHFAVTPRTRFLTTQSSGKSRVIITAEARYKTGFSPTGRYFSKATSGTLAGWTSEDTEAYGTEPRTYWGRTRLPSVLNGYAWYRHGTGSADNAYVALMINSSVVYVDLWTWGWSSGYSSTNFTDNVWFNWALVFRGGTTWEFYHNGVRGDTGAAASGAANTTAGPITNTAYASNCACDTEFFGLTNKALSAHEVRELNDYPYALVLPSGFDKRIYVGV